MTKNKKLLVNVFSRIFHFINLFSKNVRIFVLSRLDLVGNSDIVIGKEEKKMYEKLPQELTWMESRIEKLDVLMQ